MTILNSTGRADLSMAIRRKPADETGDIPYDLPKQKNRQSAKLAYYFLNDPQAKFILASNGKVIILNHRAQGLLDNNIMTRDPHGFLNFGSSQQNSQVDQILQDLKSGRAHCKRLIKRGLDDDCIVLEFSQIKYFGDAEILLTIKQDQFCSTESLNAISKMFGLTITEEDVVRRISEALCPKDIAAEMNISVNTVRAHLRSIYAKTGKRGYNRTLKLILQLLA